jgi:RimJ/RimL family protein N-acetyltransferase
MPTGMLFDCDELVAKWLFSTLKQKIYTYDRALGLVDPSGKMIGAVLFQNWNGPNLEISYYGERTMTVGVVRCLAQFVLNTFDPARLTAITSKRNRQFMRALQRLGFRLEGVQRCYYGKKDCNRNTGVRFVAFREQIEHVARINEAA